MLSKPVFSVVFLVVVILAPITSAGRASDRYDAFNHCGAPFCGSTGNAAGAGALARVDRNGITGVVNDELNAQLPKI